MTQFVPPTGEDSLSCVTMRFPRYGDTHKTHDSTHLDWHELQLNIQLVPHSKLRGLPKSTKQIPSPCNVMYRLGPSASFGTFFTGHI
jgi:hypothetical protein